MLGFSPRQHGVGAAEWTYRPALDGLRAVAVYAVVAFHAGLAGARGGFIGVDVFFVLSGYLITRVLLDEHARAGRVDLARFYSRRVRRLLPAAVVTIVVTAAATLIVDARLTRTGYVGDARSALLYVSNWHFLDRATDYFASDVAASPFLHFWSLSLEEQFYAAFPLVIIGLVALSRRSPNRPLVIAGLAALTAGSLGLQLWWAHHHPLRAYYATEARVYQPLAGAVLAVVMSTRLTSPEKRRRWASPWLAIGGVALGVLVVVATDAVDVSPSTRGIVATGGAVVLVAALEHRNGGALAWGLARRPMVDLGRISYGTYLWHWPILVLVARVVELPALSRFLLAATGATALAALSGLLLEVPIRTSPTWARWPRTVVAGGLAISILAATTVAAPILRSDRRPDVSRSGVATATAVDRSARVPVPTAAELDLVAADRTARYSCLDGAPEDCVLHTATDPARPRIHIMGDSNAAMLVPMFERLATEHDFTLSAATIVGCPWQEGLGWDVTDEVLVDNCVRERRFNDDVVVPALDPDVIIALNIPHDDPVRRTSAFVPLDPALGTGSAAVAAATASSLDRLTAGGARVVLVEPLPYGIFNPLHCMSAYEFVDECAFETTSGPNPTEVVYRDEAIARDDVFALDLDELSCPGKPLCLPVLDGVVVYHDGLHLSEPFLVAHRDDVWAALFASFTSSEVAIFGHF